MLRESYQGLSVCFQFRISSIEHFTNNALDFHNNEETIYTVIVNFFYVSLPYELLRVTKI